MVLSCSGHQRARDVRNCFGVDYGESYALGSPGFELLNRDIASVRGVMETAAGKSLHKD